MATTHAHLTADLPQTSITDPGDPPREGDDLGVAGDVSMQVHRDAMSLAYGDLRQSLAISALAAFTFCLAIAAGLKGQLPTLVGVALIYVLISTGRTVAKVVQLRRSDPGRMLTTERIDAAQRARDLFAHRTRAAMVKPWLSSTLVFVLFAIGFIQVVAGVEHSIARAALVKSALATEWWRVLTAAFLHANALHLQSNLMSLAVLGGLVEIYTARTRVALVFLISAVVGAVASTMVSPVTSLGASGGIIGLAGYLLVLSRRGANGTPQWIRKHVVQILTITALVGLVLFFVIDNAAHAGGALAGLLFGLLTIPRAGRTIAPVMAHALDQLGWLAVDVLAAVAIFTVWRLVS